jgi:hypothetical protein
MIKQEAREVAIVYADKGDGGGANSDNKARGLFYSCS